MPVTNPVQADPPGAVKEFWTDTAPAGWYVADGALKSRTVDAALFAAIGTKYGAGDGVTTFALPDAGTRFKRAAGDGLPVGTKQAQQLPDHTHTFNVDAWDGPTTDWPGGRGVGGGTGTSNPTSAPTLAGGVPGTVGTENRPEAIAVLVCIKR